MKTEALYFSKRHREPPPFGTRSVKSFALFTAALFSVGLFLLLWLFLGTDDHTFLAVSDFFSRVCLGRGCIFEPPSGASNFFLKNRNSLHAALVHAVPEFSSDHANKTYVLLPASPRPTRSESDMEYGDWRQSSNVIYVLGDYSISDSLVLLSSSMSSPSMPASRPHATDLAIDLFLPTISERETVFMGALPSAETLQRLNYVRSVSTIQSGFAKTVSPGATLLTTVPLEIVVALLGEDVYQECREKGAQFSYSEAVKEAFIEARFVKSEEELSLLKYASRLSATVHLKVEHYLKTHSTSAIFGARLQAYPPIVGAGSHAAVLHYRTGENATSGYAMISDHDFVLIDAAGEYQGYASDITRTVSRKLHWTHEMKEVYAIVAAVQQTVLDAYDVGASWLSLNNLAGATLVRQLLQYEFLHGDPQELMESEVYKLFFPHGLGHSIGLDVHDPTPKRFNVAETSKSASAATVSRLLTEYAKQSHRRQGLYGPPLTDYVIFPGHIVTIEPGVYFIPFLLDGVRENAEGLGKYINWDKIDKGAYLELGGVRIEDVVMIGVNGKKEIISRL